jgi:WhiB family redox-sensing transcriptional regulator
MDNSAWDEIWALKDTDHSWHSEALCRGSSPELFFFEAGQSKRKNYVVENYCKLCPVKQRCLDYALNNDIRFGVWGGLTQAERNRILSERKKPVEIVYNPETQKFEGKK